MPIIISSVIASVPILLLMSVLSFIYSDMITIIEFGTIAFLLEFFNLTWKLYKTCRVKFYKKRSFLIAAGLMASFMFRSRLSVLMLGLSVLLYFIEWQPGFWWLTTIVVAAMMTTICLLFANITLGYQKLCRSPNFPEEFLRMADETLSPTLEATRELLKGKQKIFSTQGHPKAEGMNLTMFYPNSWMAKEVEVTHLIQQFVSEYGYGVEKAALSSLFTLTKTEKEDFLISLTDSTKIKSGLPKGATFINAKQTTVGYLPAKMLEYSERFRMDNEKDAGDGKLFDMQTILYIFIHESTMMSLNFGMRKIATSSSQNGISKRMDNFRPLCDLMVNSIVIEEPVKKP